MEVVAVVAGFNISSVWVRIDVDYTRIPSENSYRCTLFNERQGNSLGEIPKLT